MPPLSLDAPKGSNDDAGCPLLELVGVEDYAYELVQAREAITTTRETLPERERSVVELRFAENLTQREIGERIGYSQMHVSPLLRRALGRLETAAMPA